MRCPRVETGRKIEMKREEGERERERERGEILNDISRLKPN